MLRLPVAIVLAFLTQLACAQAAGDPAAERTVAGTVSLVEGDVHPEQRQREEALKQKRTQQAEKQTRQREAQKAALQAQKRADERRRKLQQQEHSKAATKAEREDRRKRRAEKLE